MVRLERKEGNEGRRCWGLHGRRECGAVVWFGARVWVGCWSLGWGSGEWGPRLVGWVVGDEGVGEKCAGEARDVYICENQHWYLVS